jgi:hypothetical protein
VICGLAYVWLEELQGCSWAYNEPASHSGHTVTLYGLVRMGARPGFPARVVEAGFHQRAIGLVHTGAADTAAIDSQVLAIERRDHPRLADRRVVGSFGPSTIQPLVAASSLPAGSRTRFGPCWPPSRPPAGPPSPRRRSVADTLRLRSGGGGAVEPVEDMVEDADEGSQVGGRDATQQHPGPHLVVSVQPGRGGDALVGEADQGSPPVAGMAAPSHVPAGLQGVQ